MKCPYCNRKDKIKGIKGMPELFVCHNCDCTFKDDGFA
jgi:transposase-like protein